ncbi:MAG: hypothetical protein LUF32_03510 [Clostridiales bacterium]|nr:hypothetical protein [Clostridiales bacterium]
MRKRWRLWLPVFVIAAGMLTAATPNEIASANTVSDTVLPGMEDGTYTVDVELTGGSGRAYVTSPCVLIVEDGRAFAQIEWSSPYYDYMIIDGETYLPVNEDGNSVFEIPITVFDEPMTVIADTTAMSVPHEIEYTLTFDGESITGEAVIPQTAKRVACAALIIAAVCVVITAVRWNGNGKRGKSGQ